MIDESILPSEQTASKIFRSHFQEEIKQVTRFPTGLCHFVYEIVTADKSYVVRIASHSSREYLKGGLHWYPYLKNIGVQVPELYASDTNGEFSYMLLERLPGSDLGLAYHDLSLSVKKSLASAVADIQSAVSTLPAAQRFGFAFSYEQVNFSNNSSWIGVMKAEIARSEERILKIGQIKTDVIYRTKSLLHDHESYLRQVKPVPFLDDLTTKNVIVNQGKLSGIVDTDQVCFGDPLYNIGLTKMALHSLGADTDYIEFWLDAINADRRQRTMVVVYSIQFCLCFMSELGQFFNKQIGFNEEKADCLYKIYEQLTMCLE